MPSKYLLHKNLLQGAPSAKKDSSLFIQLGQAPFFSSSRNPRAVKTYVMSWMNRPATDFAVSMTMDARERTANRKQIPN